MGRLEKAHFIRRTLRQAIVVTPDDGPIPALSATVGIVFLFEADGLPQQVAMEWDLFTEKAPFMDGATSDEAGALPMRVTPEFPNLVWNNHLKRSRFGSLNCRAVPR